MIQPAPLTTLQGVDVWLPSAPTHPPLDPDSEPDPTLVCFTTLNTFSLQMLSIVIKLSLFALSVLFNKPLFLFTH